MPEFGDTGSPVEISPAGRAWEAMRAENDRLRRFLADTVRRNVWANTAARREARKIAVELGYTFGELPDE